MRPPHESLPPTGRRAPATWSIVLNGLSLVLVGFAVLGLLVSLSGIALLLTE